MKCIFDNTVEDKYVGLGIKAVILAKGGWLCIKVLKVGVLIIVVHVLFFLHNHF